MERRTWRLELDLKNKVVEADIRTVVMTLGRARRRGKFGGNVVVGDVWI